MLDSFTMMTLQYDEMYYTGVLDTVVPHSFSYAEEWSITILSLVFYVLTILVIS